MPKRLKTQPKDTLSSTSIVYLLNIFAIDSICCGIILLSTALVTEFLAVQHATCHENACHYGADAAQFLLIKGGSFTVLSSIALLSIFLILPINLYAGTASLKDDQFIKTTINHITKGSPLLWILFLFVVVVILVHFFLYATFNPVCSWVFRDFRKFWKFQEDQYDSVGT